MFFNMSGYKEPRPKKNGKIKQELPLPILSNCQEQTDKFKGEFNGLSVCINNVQEMEKIYFNGYFGKGNLSRGFTHFEKSSEFVDIIRRRQSIKRKEWSKKLGIKSLPSKVIVVPDSDSENETETYFTNLKASYDIDLKVVKEVLSLNLEEAMFLHHSLKCLDIHSDNVPLTTDEIWKLFIDSDKYFIQNYVVYHYFRAKNWIVKSGIKFGGDFLLYKSGPPFYHASYLVIIDIIDEQTLERKEDLCRRSMSTVNIVGIHRLCETAGKELLIAQIVWPKDASIKTPDDISKITLKVILFNRFILPQEKEECEIT